MGLFSFLKKKEPEPAPAITATIHAQTVEVKQRTRGELPLAEIGGYVSPSGGFVNYGRFCAVSYTHLTLPTKRIVVSSVVAGSYKKKKR